MRFKRFICACLAALVLLLAASPALAKVVSAGKEFYFLDKANVLSEATEGEIFFSNQLLYEACGAQIVVVTLDTTGSTAIDDYAYELFNSWGIGDKQKNNGFLLLMAIQDDDYYAVCGTNLQSKFSSSALKTYFDDYLEADFAAKRYDAGAKKFFEAVFARVANTYSANVTTAQGIAAYEAWAAQGGASALTAQPGGGARGSAAAGGDMSDMFILLVLAALIVLFILMMSRRGRRRRNYNPVVPPMGVTPPPPPRQPTYGGLHMPGPGGYRGNDRPNIPPSGGYRGNGGPYVPPSGGYRPSSGTGVGGSFWSALGRGLMSSGSSGRSSSRSGRSSSRSSSFGSSRGGGGRSSGGGAGRGRH